MIGNGAVAYYCLQDDVDCTLTGWEWVWVVAAIIACLWILAWLGDR